MSSTLTAKDRVLLPTNVRPTHYAIHLIPDLFSFTFKGSVLIDLDVLESSDKNTITFHSLLLDLDESKIRLTRSVDSESCSLIACTSNIEEETITLEFNSSPFQVGEKLKLFIPYVGKISEGACGFFRTSYTINGEKKIGAATQFEAVDARKAFPCWDEPSIKAVFTITLTVPRNLVALSNMPASSEVDDDQEITSTIDASKTWKTKTLVFQPSPKMSTYLVCFVIGEFEYIEKTSQTGIPVRVYAPLGKKNMGKFALDVGVKSLDYYTKYFRIPYPLPKLDMISITDMSGAMENWGLITYREHGLICDQETASLKQKVIITTFVTHEIGHQWFGNLVTMEWWKELWLNEGFATWAETQCANHIFPQWNIWTQYCGDLLAGALELDALLTSHPIEVEVAKSRDIDEIFDDISYNKGSAVIRMLATYVGDSNFSKGLHNYLYKFSYSNAVTTDLWKAISETTKMDIEKMMSNWTTKQGYPVIHISTADNGKKLLLRQQRFLASGIPTPEQDETIWSVKIGIQTKQKDHSKSGKVSKIKPHDPLGYKSLITGISFMELEDREMEMDFDTTDLEWFKANANQTGMFRVKYSDDLFQKLVTAVKNMDLSASDRFGILSDTFALSGAGLIDLDQFLTLLLSYVDEEDYTVWGSINNYLNDLNHVLQPHALYPRFLAFRKQLFSKIGAVLGWEDSPDLIATLDETKRENIQLVRPLILENLGTYGDESVIAECKKRFEAGKSNPASIPANLRGAIFNVASAFSDNPAETIEDMKKIYRSTDDIQLQILAVFAASSTRSAPALKSFIDWAFSSDGIRTNQYIHAFRAATTTQSGREIIWDYLTQNWESVVSKCKHGPFLFVMMVENATSKFATPEWATTIRNFFETHHVAGLERTPQQSIEKIMINHAWATRSLDAVDKWLEAHGF